MASFQQQQLFVDKDLDICFQNILRPFTEHVYFPETPIDPLETQSMFIFSFRRIDWVLFLEHHHDVQIQNLSISDTLTCATCQIQFADRSEQVHTSTCSSDSSSSMFHH